MIFLDTRENQFNKYQKKNCLFQLLNYYIYLINNQKIVLIHRHQKLY